MKQTGFNASFKSFTDLKWINEVVGTFWRKQKKNNLLSWFKIEEKKTTKKSIAVECYSKESSFKSS